MIDILDNHNKIKNEIETLIKNGATREDIAKYLLRNSKDVKSFLIYSNRKTFYNKTTEEYERYYKDLTDAIMDSFNSIGLELETLQECRKLDKSNSLCNIAIGIEENEINKLFEQNINVTTDEILELCPKWYYFESEDFGIHMPIKLSEVYDINKYKDCVFILKEEK